MSVLEAYSTSQQRSLSALIDPALYLKAKFEGFSAKPYLCPAGVPTIGFGNTYYADGRKVTLSDRPISSEEGHALMLAVTMKDFLPGIAKACPRLLPYSLRTGDSYKLSAILSFVYNVGNARLLGSTLRVCINDETRWSEVPSQLVKWNKAGGRVLKGLTLRRLAEAEYWLRFDLWNKYRNRSYSEVGT